MLTRVGQSRGNRKMWPNVSFSTDAFVPYSYVYTPNVVSLIYVDSHIGWLSPWLRTEIDFKSFSYRAVDLHISTNGTHDLSCSAALVGRHHTVTASHGAVWSHFIDTFYILITFQLDFYDTDNFTPSQAIASYWEVKEALGLMVKRISWHHKRLREQLKLSRRQSRCRSFQANSKISPI